MSDGPLHLDADGLRTLLAGGAEALRVNQDAVNALNVFPVPDGDTGLNMFKTLEAVVLAVGQAPDAPLTATARAAAHGALMGARGNSGVIFSQFIRGVAQALDGLERATPAHLAGAFDRGGAATYNAVSNPVEGTMLTVMRRTGEAMLDAVHAADDAVALLEVGLSACRAAVLRTPEQLPVLRDAGVVDAGGQGFSVFLEGALRALRGEDAAAVSMDGVDGLGHISASFLASVEGEDFGFCTQFIVSGPGLDVDAIRAALSVNAHSTVVIGDERTVRVHVHTLTPDDLLELGRGWGEVGQVKVESMDQQHAEVRAARADAPPAAVGVVAVVRGPGLEELYRSLGVGVIVTGGQTMNPSTQELVDAIASLNAEAAILLPNNKNVVPAAKQAAELAPVPTRVAPTTTLQQGIAAMLAFTADDELDDVAGAMSEGAEGVVSGEVVTAVRDAQVDGRPVRAGEVMALLEGRLCADAAATPHDAVAALIDAAAPVPGALVTLYWGGDVSQADADAAADAIRALAPDAEVEVVYGGQPHYHYLVSIE